MEYGVYKSLQRKVGDVSVSIPDGRRLGRWARALCVWLSLCLSTQGFVANAQTVYFHNDTGGSPIAATDEQGGLLWRESYRPYGERVLKPAAANSQWFHGKQEDPDTGMSDFGARNYDPVLGRFLSIDPVDFTESNIHSFNRYNYGNNNPLKYHDPDGRFANLLIGLLIALGSIGVVAGAMQKAGGVKSSDSRTPAQKDAGMPPQSSVTVSKPTPIFQNDAGSDSGSDEEGASDSGEYGCVYCVPGEHTSSGNDYIGSSDKMDQRKKDKSDGRNRDHAEVVDKYPKGDRDARRAKEQQAINDRGGVDKLDNKRNEIAPHKWASKGVNPP